MGYLAEHPLCLDCIDEDRVTPSQQIHHKIKIADGGDMYDEDNLMELCAGHHSVRTNRGE